MSLDIIRRNIAKPPRVVLYGVPGIGKTTLACSAPSPIVIPVEDGLAGIEVDHFPQPTTLDEVYGYITKLVESDHDYKTLVLDSLDKLEPLIWDAICAQGNKKRIEDFGFGKGYTNALSEWRNLLAGLDALRDKGMTVITVAHSTVAKVEPPDSDQYDRWQMRLNKHAEATVSDWADAILFANYETKLISSGETRKRAIGDGTRQLLTTERPAWRAKNRYRMPDVLPMDWTAIAQYFPV